jgi:hypothetical protein
MFLGGFVESYKDLAYIKIDKDIKWIITRNLLKFIKEFFKCFFSLKVII